jgi:hypothetical protein
MAGKRRKSKTKPRKTSYPKSIEDIMNWIIISDTHFGCQLGLCPPDGVILDEGGRYIPSSIQGKVFSYWTKFWDEWVPMVTRNEPFGVIINGDTLDGVHHRSTTQISHNLTDQAKLASIVLQPIVDRCHGYFFMIRGTEAHVGASGQEEERLAKDLGAIPNEFGQHARYELWKKVGGGLVHLLHHIGTTGSQAYEATAVHKEMVEEFTEAGRWSEQPPDIVVRSHRHRYIQTEIASDLGTATSVVTPGWQAKTPFVWKIPGGRLSPPQFGGIIIRQGDEELHVRHKVWTIGRSKVE